MLTLYNKHFKYVIILTFAIYLLFMRSCDKSTLTNQQVINSTWAFVYDSVYNEVYIDDQNVSFYNSVSGIYFIIAYKIPNNRSIDIIQSKEAGNDTIIGISKVNSNGFDGWFFNIKTQFFSIDKKSFTLKDVKKDDKKNLEKFNLEFRNRELKFAEKYRNIDISDSFPVIRIESDSSVWK